MRATAIPLVFGLVFAPPTLAAADEVVIGVPSWSSGVATAHVLKAAIEDSFEVSVDLLRDSNAALFEAMDAGTAHIHPEVWLPNHADLSNAYIVERKTVAMSPRGMPASQGICTTRNTKEAHGVTSVDDLADPETAALFDTTGDGRGEMWIGASEWASTQIERIRAHSYGHAETMQLIEAEEEIAAAMIDAAVAVDKPLVFYCYQPHHVFELHDIVQLDEPVHDPRRWMILSPTDDAEWLENSRADVAWPVSFFHIHYARALAEEHPEIAAFLDAVELDVDTVSEMTYALIVERRDAEEFALDWVKANEQRVSSWHERARRRGNDGLD